MISSQLLTACVGLKFPSKQLQLQTCTCVKRQLPTTCSRSNLRQEVLHFGSSSDLTKRRWCGFTTACGHQTHMCCVNNCNTHLMIWASSTCSGWFSPVGGRKHHSDSCGFSIFYSDKEKVTLNVKKCAAAAFVRAQHSLKSFILVSSAWFYI